MERILRRDWIFALALGVSAGLASLAASQPQTLLLLAPIPLIALAWWTLAGAERWVLAFVVAAVLLPPLPLPLGDAGPHPALLLAALGLLAGAARLGEWRFRFDLAGVALLFFFFALLLSVPLALLYSGWAVAGGSLARLGLAGISIYTFFYLARGPGRELAPERLIRTLFWAGFASVAFACLDFYFQFPALARFAQQYVWLESGVFRRAQGVFYEATTLGCFCVFLLVMIAAMAVQRSSTRLRLSPLWLLAAMPVLLAALIFCFSRSAIGSLIVALAALAWIEGGRWRGQIVSARSARWMLAAFVVLLAATILGARFFPDLLAAYFLRLRYTGEFLFSAPGQVLAPRFESWGFLLSYIAEHPWQTVFGIGYKTLPYTSYLGRPVVADNMYLSILVETGWLGLAALLTLNIVILAASYRSATRAESPEQRLCGAWIFAFWCGQILQMLSGDILTYWRLLPLYFAVLAIAVRGDESSPPRPVQ